MEEEEEEEGTSPIIIELYDDRSIDLALYVCETTERGIRPPWREEKGIGDSTRGLGFGEVGFWPSEEEIRICFKKGGDSDGFVKIYIDSYRKYSSLSRN